VPAVLVASSREPFFAAARALLAQGSPADGTIVVRREVSHIQMRGRLYVAAKLSESSWPGTPSGPGYSARPGDRPR
jgi:hypothetical protein